MALIAAVVALATPAPCNTSACVERVAMHRCADGRVGSCIHRAAIHWRVSESMLRRKAHCESRFNPGAYNPSGAIGLFQFMSSTWRTTPYRRHSPWSAKWSALAAAWMHRVGRGREWTCQ
jgi:soluble lytic murein transglycosylase-like protein